MFCVVPVTNKYILGHTLNWNNSTSMYQDEPSMYRYIRYKTKCMALHYAQDWTEDLVHNKQHIIPLRYQREHMGGIDGLNKVYIHCVGHSRRVVPSGWWRTSGAGPAAPPAQAMISLVRASTWTRISSSWKPRLAVQHCLEAAMWCQTAARLRNRPLIQRLTSSALACAVAPGQLEVGPV